MLGAARLAFGPDLALATLAFALGGAALGTVSGLTPGLHANNFALLLAAMAPAVPGPPALVGAAMLAAGVVHTFLDAVPALALGVPDAAMAAGALPGHRLVLAGRGREALRLSALGSGLAVAVAVPVAVPLTAAMTAAYPALRTALPGLLAAVVVATLATEPTWDARLGGVAAFGLSAALGLVTLDLPAPGVLGAGGVLTPLFAGLFGAPVLLDAVGGSGVPPQDDARVTLPHRAVARTALSGAGGGALVGYLPGVSAAIAATLALSAAPRGTGARGFVVASSGANTANTIFALFALVALGTPRTGVMVAISEARVPLSVPRLVAVAVLASAVGFALVPTLGDAYLRTVGRVDATRLSAVMLGFLAFLSVGFAGWVGLPVFAAATAIGLLPPRLRTRRVHLMGVLIGPLILG